MILNGFLPARPSLHEQDHDGQRHSRQEQHAGGVRVPFDRDLALLASQIATVHEGRTAQEPPYQRVSTLLLLLLLPVAIPIPIDGLEPLLQTSAQRAREDAPANRAAEAPREAAERPDQARRHVVGVGRGQVQHVGEGVIQSRARAEAVREQDEYIQHGHMRRPSVVPLRLSHRHHPYHPYPSFSLNMRRRRRRGEDAGRRNDAQDEQTSREQGNGRQARGPEGPGAADVQPADGEPAQPEAEVRGDEHGAGGRGRQAPDRQRVDRRVEQDGPARGHEAQLRRAREQGPAAAEHGQGHDGVGRQAVLRLEEEEEGHEGEEDGERGYGRGGEAVEE